ncbi:MAG TPA: SGNH/GDSL hydrolase family protein [Baekduia sp.]|uniref:SGNH/GDSL hydrolase family protein n=1 Tax=Baekduia sp. TaxID=2600305 RepID=UPI002C3A803F|nr:SGNH/GDSL hydrolase family protein [Baekduia sp.]HMJ35828.1 SGNH/GDSL hydrolase family protein [Baekduia sp.]
MVTTAQRTRRLTGLALAAACLALTPAAARAAELHGPLTALGDSFSAGEGAPPYDPASKGCDLSDDAWGIVLADFRQWDHRHVACSGAVIADVLQDDLARGRRSQISHLVDDPPGVVTLTVGGNDAGFKDVLIRCGIVTACQSSYRIGGVDQLDQDIGDVEARLPAVYQAIHAAAPQAALVVTGYPRLFPARPTRPVGTSALGITPDEMVYLNQKTQRLNAAIQRVATTMGAIYTDVGETFDGHEVTTRDHWINVPTGLDDNESWQTVFRNPTTAFHPTAAGYRQLARAVKRTLDAGTGSGTGGAPSARVVDQLARRFQPVLLLDTHERWRPLDVERMLEEGWHRACRPGHDTGCPHVLDAPWLSRLKLVSGEQSRFLQIDGRRDLDRARFTSADRSCGETECAPQRIYVHVSQDPDDIYLDYWWYFRFNDADAGTWDHQSDWEGVTVAVDRKDLTTFDWVAFAQHTGVQRYLRATLTCDGVELRGNCGTESSRHGRHVNVFVADGTHATYPTSCNRRGGNPDLLIPTCLQQSSMRPERDHDGRLRWGGNGRPGSVDTVGRWAWWPGVWDPGRHVQSPGAQSRFRNPRWVQDVSCSRASCAAGSTGGFEGACAQWFGVNVTAAACDGDVIDTGDDGLTRLRLERGLRGLTSALGDPTDELAGSSTPGVAQLLGASLRSGEVLGVAGTAGTDAELYLRTGEGPSAYDARFTGLGLEQGGRATVTVGPAGAGGTPVLVLRRPDGTRGGPRAVVAVGT